MRQTDTLPAEQNISAEERAQILAAFDQTNLDRKRYVDAASVFPKMRSKVERLFDIGAEGVLARDADLLEYPSQTQINARLRGKGVPFAIYSLAPNRGSRSRNRRVRLARVATTRETRYFSRWLETAGCASGMLSMST